MRTIRASEVGSFVFCQRAWWYQRQGLESSNQEQMAHGSRIHQRHGRQVLAAGCLRYLAYGLLLLALGLLAASLTAWLL